MFWSRTSSGRVLPIFLVLLCFSTFSHPQDSPGDFSKNVHVVPAPSEPAPFGTARDRRKPAYTVSFHDVDQLPPQDRLLISNAESTIAELARSSGLEYNDTQWNSREVSCPTFTNHLFLQFSRDNGRGDVSVFSASIPRNGIGRTRMIPILKRSYSLFSPAPINALTISAFNHIRTEEGQNANDDWLGNALCYAALAGSHPHIAPSDAWPWLHNPVPPLTAVLDVQFSNKGEEVISFDDMGAPAHPMEWTMTFTREGKLMKATHKPAGMLRAQPVPEKSAFTKSHRVP